MNTIRNLLAQYLLRVNQLQIMGEKLRQSLCQNPYFQAQTVFERLDRFRKGYLVPSDISEFLLENGVYPSQFELYIIFRSIDKKRLGTITIDDLINEILPHQNPNRRQKALSNKYYPARPKLEIDLEYALSRYFAHKIKEHQDFQITREKMKNIYSNYFEEAFSLADRDKKTVLSTKDIDTFLRYSGKVLSTEQINRIFVCLSQGKQKISYKLFLEHIQPFMEGFYPAYAERVIEKRQAQNIYHSKVEEKANQLLRKSQKQAETIYQIENLRNTSLKLRQLLNQKQEKIRDQIIKSRLTYY